MINYRYHRVGKNASGHETDPSDAKQHCQSQPLPSFESNKYLYEYITASNGVFLRAERAELVVLLPIATPPANLKLRGLAALEPYIQFRLPLVPSEVLENICESAYRAATGKSMQEKLFYLNFDFDQGNWNVNIPAQVATSTAVHPQNDVNTQTIGSQSIIELHSHHFMPARFSSTDDGDEQGFKLYVVVGALKLEHEKHGSFSMELKVRIGIYGHFFPVPYEQIFEPSPSIRQISSKVIIPSGLGGGQRSDFEAPNK